MGISWGFVTLQSWRAEGWESYPIVCVSQCVRDYVCVCVCVCETIYATPWGIKLAFCIEKYKKINIIVIILLFETSMTINIEKIESQVDRQPTNILIDKSP